MSQLAAGVASPDDEHRSVGQLLGMRVNIAVQVLPRDSNPAGESREPGFRERPSRGHHVARGDLAHVRDQGQPVPMRVDPDAMHADAPHRDQAQLVGVVLEIDSDFISSRVPRPSTREGDAWQGRVSGRGEEAERVPSSIPRTIGGDACVEDHEVDLRLQPCACQGVTHR